MDQAMTAIRHANWVIQMKMVGSVMRTAQEQTVVTRTV